MKEKISTLSRFLQKDIWNIRIEELPRFKQILYNSLKTLLVAIRGFVVDQCSIRGSALTILSLLSLVPVLALGFGIAQGFGLKEILEEQIASMLTGQEEILRYVLSFTDSMLSRTKGGMIAGIGLIVLLFTIMQLLNSIETSFNAIWEVKVSRTFLRKFTDYTTIMLFAPILVILAGSISVFIQTMLKSLFSQNEILQKVSPIVFSLVKIVPFVLISLVFSLLYIIMPNTRVRVSAALIAGTVAGVSYQFTQFLYISFQVSIGSYNAIYGSFAALPLFLTWMQLSWYIVLFGAELTFAIQNVENVVFQGNTKISHSFKRKLALWVMHLISSRFADGKPPLSIVEISKELKISQHYVHFILDELLECNLIAEVKIPDKVGQVAYQPSQDIHRLTVKYIIEAIDNKGVSTNISQNKTYQTIEETLNEFEEVAEQTSAGKLLIRLNEEK